jgi:hypothetical protein
MLEECPVCGIEFKKSKNKTCSRKCGADYKMLDGFKMKLTKATAYQTIAYREHDRKCVICSERRVLEVHHYNGEHSDDSPENLVPMCPTHHRYMHSKYRYILETKVDFYVAERWGRDIETPLYHKEHY